MFFLGREVPREQLLLVVRSFGGEAGWDGEGSPIREGDERITHQVGWRVGWRKTRRPGWLTARQRVGTVAAGGWAAAHAHATVVWQLVDRASTAARAAEQGTVVWGGLAALPRRPGWPGGVTATSGCHATNPAPARPRRCPSGGGPPHPGAPLPVARVRAAAVGV